MNWFTLLLFLAGLFLLLKGGGALVAGASALAKHWRVSDRIVGLTVVAIGTSLPELTVNIISSAQGNPELAFGNIFGSNIANILLILGVSALIYPLTLSHQVVVSEIPFAILAVLLAGFLVNVQVLGEAFQGVARWEGGLLLFYYVLFMLYVFRAGRLDQDRSGDVDPREDRMSRRAGLVRVLLGIGALVLGGKWVVDGAVGFASYMGMSKGFVGLTIVAIGTSLPELITSVTAALKKNSGIAIGNVVGSNIFNVFWILGLSGLIIPLPFEKEQNLDIAVALFATTSLLLFLPFSKREELRWPAGLILFLAYIGYMVFLLARG